MGFFMRNLHRQIERLHTESRNNQGPMTIYRGQSMSSRQFEMIVNSKGGLLSFNNFLSTSIDRDVSLVFAECDKHDPNLVGILFQMEVKPELASTPFVSLDKISNYDHEKEILFSMHSVFRIGEIKQIEDRLWQVELTLTESNDEQLEHLTEYIRQEIGGWPGWYRLGNLLARIGEFDYAEEVYNTLLNSTSDNDRKAHAHICHQLGSIKSDKGDPVHSRCIKRRLKSKDNHSLPTTHRWLARTATWVSPINP
jgi:tetratricopeptide (TPR) repeat protein